MRLLYLLLILTHLPFPFAQAASETSASKKKPALAKSKSVTLPKEVGDELTNKAKQCDDALQALNGTINGGTSCARKAQVKEQGKDQQDKILSEMGMTGPPVLEYEAKSDKRVIKGRTTQYTDLAGKEITLSVLTPAEADQLTEKLSQNISDLKYDKPGTGCFARAHFLGQRIQDLGYEAGKMWFEPRFLLGKIDPILEGQTERRGKAWQYHVSPFILVDNNGKIEERIIDFSLSKKALPLSEFKSQLSPRPYLIQAQASNRFAYDLQDRWHNKTYYNGSDSASAIQELKCVEKDLRDGTHKCRPIDSHW
jgi:hypothetical protein